MSTKCRFDFLEAKDVEVRFDGGRISTDAGLNVFIEWMKSDSFIEPFADVLKSNDPRRSNRIDHTIDQLVRQRVLQIVAGYEDANDSDELAEAPLFCAANDRADNESPNASQPTISRLENAVSAKIPRCFPGQSPVIASTSSTFLLVDDDRRNGPCSI